MLSVLFIDMLGRPEEPRTKWHSVLHRKSSQDDNEKD